MDRGNVHIWWRGVENGMPVLRCQVCDHIWYPDQKMPENDCRD